MLRKSLLLVFFVGFIYLSNAEILEGVNVNSEPISFFPEGDTIFTMKDKSIDLSIEAKGNEIMTFNTGDLENLFDNVTCVSEDGSILEKSIEKNGQIRCFTKDKNQDIKKILVKHNDDVVKTYDVIFVDYDPSKSQLFLTTLKAGRHFSMTYSPRNSQGGLISPSEISYLMNILKIESSISISNKRNNGLGIVYTGYAPTSAGNKAFKIYYMDNNQKIYVTNTTVTVRPDDEIDIQKSSLGMPSVFFTSSFYPSNTNTISINIAKDTYGNIMDTTARDIKISIFSSFGSTIWSRTYHANENNEIIFPATDIDVYVKNWNTVYIRDANGRTLAWNYMFP